MSSNALEIKEQNRFTATEFVTLIPMSGNGIHQELIKRNTWVLNYFPNYNQTEKIKSIKKNRIKQFSEFLLKGIIGAILEKQFMKITKKHQQKKFKKLEKKDFEIAFKGNENASKHHPGNHQVRVINLLNDKINAFNKQHKLSIPLEK